MRPHPVYGTVVFLATSGVSHTVARKTPNPLKLQWLLESHHLKTGEFIDLASNFVARIHRCSKTQCKDKNQE